MKNSSTLCATVIFIFMALPLGAQEFDLMVERVGRSGFVIDLNAKEANLLEVLGAIAKDCGYQMLNASGDVTAALDREKVVVSMIEVPVEDLVRDLAESVGFRAEIDRRAAVLRIGVMPKEGDPNAGEFFRQRGIEALLDAYGTTTKDEKHEYRLRSAELDFLSPDHKEVRQGLKKLLLFLDDEEDAAKYHPEGPSSCLRGAHEALRIGDAEMVWAFYDRFLKKFPEHPARAEARILGARGRILEKAWIEASRMLESMRAAGSRGRVERRQSLIAELLLAEVHLKLDDPETALRVLSDIEPRHSPDERRLLALAPYFRGQAHRRLGQLSEASLNFRHAAHLATEKSLRLKALLGQAQTELAGQHPFRALTTARIGLASESTGRLQFDLERTAARASLALDLEERAVVILEGLAAKVDDLLAQDPERDQKAASLLDEIATLRVERGEIDEAITLFRALGGHPRLGQRARFMEALCLHRRDEHGAAVKILEKLEDEGIPISLRHRITKLRGDCLMALRLYERAVDNYREDSK